MYDETLKLVRLSETEVKVYLPSPVMRFRGDNTFIPREESYYITKRDEETDHSYKIMYDRIRATLKYAGTVGASLVEPVGCNFLGNHKYELVMHFDFPSSHESMEFLLDANLNVGGATMK